MTVDRFKLIAGPYAAPLFELGDVVSDELRGDVKITAISDGRIQWPKGRRLDQKGGHAGLVLFADLERAVRTESNQAVCYWWGVTAQTVSKWRAALDVEATEGTRKLRRAHGAEEWFKEARSKAHEQSRDDEADASRREKIAASKTGKKRPRSLMRRLAAANRGRQLNEETRAKMSQAHRKRGTIPPAAGESWTAQEDALVRSLPVAEAAEETGRTVSAVYKRRRKLRVPDGRRN